MVSPASCGVNALTVMAKVLLDRFGLRYVSTSVVLAMQGWQRVHDAMVGTSRDDPRLGRAAGDSIVPHNYVVGDLIRRGAAARSGRSGTATTAYRRRSARWPS